jgi:hypothetical protein
MSDDLVKDLRNSGWYLAKPAADRIEKLEAALRMVIDWDNTLDWEDGPAWGDLMDIARKALEENPEKSVYKEGYRAVEEAMGHPSPEFWVERKYDR